jgi:hypothetical protein
MVAICNKPTTTSLFAFVFFFIPTDGKSVDCRRLFIGFKLGRYATEFRWQVGSLDGAKLESLRGGWLVLLVFFFDDIWQSEFSSLLWLWPLLKIRKKARKERSRTAARER